jgi:hypothetical protein
MRKESRKNVIQIGSRAFVQKAFIDTQIYVVHKNKERNSLTARKKDENVIFDLF